MILFPLTKEKAYFINLLSFLTKKKTFQLLSFFSHKLMTTSISKWTTSWVVFLWSSIHLNHYSLFWESLRVMDQVLTTNQYVSMLLVLTIPACGWSPYRNFGRDKHQYGQVIYYFPMLLVHHIYMSSQFNDKKAFVNINYARIPFRWALLLQAQ